MNIGLIDVDGHNYPNIPLMKLSAWHKAQGDNVTWYEPMFSGHLDRVYMSKVFSFTEDYKYPINADEVVRGGSGYCIHLENGKETFDKSADIPLPDEIEHIYPDYTIYDYEDTAYGFMSRGCPRACAFCHVAAKEGKASKKVADLSEFWRGQPHIEILDPNTLACHEWGIILEQLARSGAEVNFSQGLDIRMMSDEKAKALSQIKVSKLHFAWDRYEDKDMILPKFEAFRKVSRIRNKNLIVYVLCNFGTTIEQDLERIYTLRNMGFAPYVMLYDKDNIPRGHVLRKLQRWCNNRFVFWSVEKFDDYMGGGLMIMARLKDIDIEGGLRCLPLHATNGKAIHRGVADSRSRTKHRY